MLFYLKQIEDVMINKLTPLLLILPLSFSAQANEPNKWEEAKLAKEMCIEAGFYPKGQFSVSPTNELLSVIKLYREQGVLSSLEATSDVCRVALKRISRPSGSGAPSKELVPTLNELKSGVAYSDKLLVSRIKNKKIEIQDRERRIVTNLYAIESLTHMSEMLLPLVSEFKQQRELATTAFEDFKATTRLHYLMVNDIKAIDETTFEVVVQPEGSSIKSRTKGILKSTLNVCERCSNARMYLYASEKPEMVMNGETPVFGILHTRAEKLDDGVNEYKRLEHNKKTSMKLYSDISQELSSVECRLKEIKEDHGWDIKKLDELKQELNKIQQ